MHFAQRRRGFSLIEMMVVISVIAILALVALPTYTDKIIRDQVAEALPLADIAKPAIAAAWRSSQPLPADNTAAGLPEAGKIVNSVVGSVTVQDGAIQIAFGNRAHKALQGKLLSVRPAGVADSRIVPLTWLCGAAPAPTPMTVQGNNRTSVPAGLLPMRCR